MKIIFANDDYKHQKLIKILPNNNYQRRIQPKEN